MTEQPGDEARWRTCLFRVYSVRMREGEEERQGDDKKKKSKLQVLSFMYVPNCRHCPLSLKLMSFVLNVCKSCTLCPLVQTQLDFLVKSDHPGVF
ncbi:hypothetical protein Hanom_Chr16g01421141 [Helianthus anomalus]